MAESCRLASHGSALGSASRLLRSRGQGERDTSPWLSAVLMKKPSTRPRSRANLRRTRTNARHATKSAVVVLPAVFLLGVFLLKLTVMSQLKDHVLTQPDAGLDTTTYVELARRVLGGDLSLGPGLYFVSPLYIYFLAAVFGVTGSFTAVRLLQIILGTAAVACVFVAADEWFGRRAAMLAACLAALTGLFTFYESLLLQAALDPFLTSVAIASLALGFRRNDDRWYLVAGIAFGLQTLNRPNVVLASCGIVVLLAATRRWRKAAVFAAAMTLALSPLALRNVAVAGIWSPVSSHGGLNFYIGNNPDAEGTYRSVSGIRPNLEGQQDDARQVAERAVGQSLDDAQVSAYFYSLGWKWIGEQPLAAARLFIRKFSLVFSSADIWLNYSYPFFKYDAHTPLRALFVGPWILIPLGLFGLVAAASRTKKVEYLIWASFVLMYAVAVAMFFVADRYTLPLLIPLCVASGAAVDWFVRAFSNRKWMHLAIAAGAFGVLFAAVNRPLEIDNGISEERVRMAERLVTLGRYEEAEQWAARAETVSPRPGLVHFRLGQRLLTRDQSTAAIAHFEKALRFDPGQAEVEFALGKALLDAARPSEAALHLRRAVDAGFHADLAGFDLVRALGAAGERVEAIRVLQTLRPARQEDPEGWLELGDLAIRLQEPKLAASFFREAIARRPDFAPAYLGLAVAEAGMGLRTEARQHAQDALRLDPHSERARQLQEILK
jgi:tetratricopeptide (TPR) repeat protein